MADEAPINRRRYPRAGPVIIRCEFSHRASAAEGYLVSLSEAGAFLSTDERIAVGERLVLRVSLPWQMGEIHAEAEVIYEIAAPDSGHQSSPGVGITFVNLGLEEQERIRRYVVKFHELATRLGKQASSSEEDLFE